jgi:hypothetical protein
MRQPSSLGCKSITKPLDSHGREGFTKPGGSHVYYIRTGVPVVAGTLDEVGISSPDSFSERCSGHTYAHV